MTGPLGMLYDPLKAMVKSTAGASANFISNLAKEGRRTKP